MSNKPIYVRVDSNGNPIDPVPAGYKFQGFFNPTPGGQGQSWEQNYSQGAAGRLAASGYNQQQPRPQAPGAQAEWDYRNPMMDPSGRPLGPMGESLPYGAKQWDAFGRPYYGGGLQGYVRGMISRLTDPGVAKAPGVDGWMDWIKKGLITQLTSRGDLSKMLPIVQEGAALAGQTAEAATAGGGEKPLVTTYAGRAVGEVVRGILAGAQMPAEQYERLVVGSAGALQEMGEGSPLPAVPELGNWGDFFIQNNPIVMGYNAIRAVSSPKSYLEKTEIAQRNLDAGRMAYSGYIDPAAKQEFFRRYQAGEDPYLLAMELQNPWAEIGGQLLFDPLNLVGYFTKGTKSASLLREADVFLRPDPTVMKAASAFSELAGDARAGEALQTLVQADMAAMAARSEQMVKAAKDYSPFALTAAGKRYILSYNTSTLAAWLTANAGPDEAGGFLKAMALAASEDVDEATAGITTLMRFKFPQPLISEAGYQTRYMLRELMTFDGEFSPEKFMKLFDKTGGDMGEVANVLARRLAKASDDLIPTISEARKATEGPLKEWYANLNPVLKAVDRFNESAQSVVGPVNRFFAGIYMGMSPGYAFRNALNNTFTTLVDMGPKAAAEGGEMSFAQTFSPGKLVARKLDDTARWLGGVTPKGATTGFGPVASLESRPTKGIFSVGLNVSENIEKGVSTVIVNRMVDETMRKMLKPGRALPDIQPLIEAGMKPELAQTLGQYIVANYGDVKAARTAFMEAASTGRLDVVNLLSSWASPEDVKALEKFGFLNEIQNMIQRYKGVGEGPEAAATELKAYLRQILDKADQVKRETPGIPPEVLPEAASTVRDLDKVVKSGNITNEMADLLQRQMVANSMVFRSYDDALMEILRTHTLPKPLRDAIDQASDLLSALMKDTRTRNDDFVHAVWKWNDNIKARVKQPGKWKDIAASLGIDRGKYNIKDERSFFTALWKEIGMPGEEEDMIRNVFAHPDVLSGKVNMRKAFLDYMWDGWFRPTRSSFWASARDEYAKAMDELFAQMEAVGGDIGILKRKSVLDAQENLKVAQQFDDAEYLGNGLFVPKGTIQPGSAEQLRLRFSAFIDQPVEKLPPDVAEAIQLEARALLEEVTRGQAGGKIFEEGKFIGSYGSSYQKWYGEIAKAGGGREGVIKALEKIINGERDAGKTVGRLKSVIVDRLMEQGDPIILWRMGEREEAVKAFDKMIEGQISTYEVMSREGADELWDAWEKWSREMTDKALVTPHVDGPPPTLPRVYYEQKKPLSELFDRLINGVQENWNKNVPVEFEPGLRDTLDKWLRKADSQVAKARLTATATADAMRDFALLNYNKKTYFDLALAYIYPYHFWYTRTYANWLKRMAFNPEIVAGYAKYKQQLEKVHAGMPEWWKYNVNTNELFGLDSENPLFFNLEAALNPLNGLTGVDFTDPYKRVNWWTTALDDLAKFGPTVWTPIQLATAVALNQRGETEAASRWAGRLLPQSASVKSAAAMLGLGAPEIDPAVLLLSGGLDPYERRRVGRALGTMIQEGAITEAQASDAARLQTGDVWQMAIEKAARERGPGTLSSFMLGVGFKGRSASEVETDRMYQDYHSLWAMEPNLSPEEFRAAMEGLRTKYPFMDAVLMSRKGGDARDRSYAYNVLGRIPPGQKTALAKAAGVDPRLMDKFYEDKGHFEGWPETEQSQFKVGMATIGAMLDVPDDATRQEWAQVAGQYSRMMRDGQKLFGEDIWQRVDIYYAAKGNSYQDREASERILAADPVIEMALDWKNEQILSDPLVSAYYGGVEDLRSFYKGQMYDQIDKELGPGVSTLWSEYFLLKNTGQMEQAKAFWDQNEQTFKRYIEIRDAYAPITNQFVMSFAYNLPETKPAWVREDAPNNTIMSQDMLGALQPDVPVFDWSEWQMVLSDPLQQLLVNSYIGGAELPTPAQMEIDYLAGQMGMPAEQLVQMIQASIANQQ